MNYAQTFTKRATSFVNAMKKNPNVLNEEFQAAIEVLNPVKGDTIVNIPCGFDQLEKRVKECKIYNFDINKEFCEYSGATFCQLNKIPLANESVDKVFSMAALHHATEQERSEFYRECYRVLKKGGKLVIGDVQKDSGQAEWLNGFVNTYNSLGHSGLFFCPEDSELMEKEGFLVKTEVKNYFWTFESEEKMVSFCREFFYLDKLSGYSEHTSNLIISESVRKILGYQNTETRFSWKLIYFTCLK